LKYLDVRDSGLHYFPSRIDDLSSLQVLNLGPGKWVSEENTPPGTEGAKLWTVGPSFKEVCKLTLLTEFRSCGMKFSGRKLPHNISALSKLKVLDLGITNIETLPGELGYWFIQLEAFTLYYSESLRTLPSSFTRRKAFPSLINFSLCKCSKFVELPEVEIGALPKLQTHSFLCCESRQSFPLSLDLLTSLRKLTLPECGEKLRNFCEKSTIWTKFDIQWSSPINPSEPRLNGIRYIDWSKM
jgi:hypothetical protein